MTTPTAEQIADAANVLAKIKANDHTFANPDPAMAIAWAECFAEYALELPDLLAGVTKIFADDKRTRDRVLPGDVIAKARDVRRDRIARETPDERRVRENQLDQRLQRKLHAIGRDINDDPPAPAQRFSRSASEPRRPA